MAPDASFTIPAPGAILNSLLMTAGGWLADPYGERVRIVAGVMTMLYSRLFVGFVAAWLMVGVGEALLGPAYNSLPTPYIGGQLWEHLGPRVPFLSGLSRILPSRFLQKPE